jgi:hypothetical protein
MLLPSSNLSLSNLITSTGVGTTAPFSACNLYTASNVSAQIPARGNTYEFRIFQRANNKYCEQSTNHDWDWFVA